MGTVTTNARAAVDALRAKGKKVGLAKLRTFRPFPSRQVRALAEEVGTLGVVDRSFTFGAAGAAFTEVAAEAARARVRPALAGFIAGLGGRDVPPEACARMFEALLGGKAGEAEWLDLRERKEAAAHA
jgi:pyruvate/2-oxoacid:ferredoxin oxidoreductase alpha subunit